jgi:hypothetical protein
MADPVTGIIGGSALLGAGTSLYSGQKGAKAAKGAARAQTAATQEAVKVQQQQLDVIRNILAPYIQAGKPDLTQPYIQAGGQALQGMQGLLGLRGAGEQQAAIQGIEQGAQFQEMARQGEQGILQNAAATGGLRGGNVQGALAQFRPALLNQLIESQYGKLAGLTAMGGTAAQNLLGIGQQTAAGLTSQEQQAAANVGNFMTQMGAAQAAGITGAANAQAQGLGGAVTSIGNLGQNLFAMQQASRPSMSSGIGTGGFAGTYQQAQKMYGGAPVAYFAPEGPGGPGGWYKQS